MKITIERSRALAALNKVFGVVPSRTTIPILGNVFIGRVDDDSIVIRGTDMDMESVVVCEADVHEGGTTTVDASKMRDIFNAAAQGSQISLELTGDDPRMTVKSGRSRFKLPVLSAADYPAMPTHDGARFTIGAAELKAMIDYVAFAMSTEETRYFLNGALFTVRGGVLRLVATDGHKLAKIDGPEIEEFSPVIVPRKAVVEVQRALSSYSGEVSVVVGNSVSFCMGPHTIVTKQIDGTFPDYERVIPRDWSKEIVADSALLTAAIKRAVIAADDRASAVVLAASDGSVAVFRKGETEARDEFDAETGETNIEIGFNAKYVLDTLSRISGDVSIRLSDPASPTVWVAAGDDRGLAVVMPLRV